MTDRAVLKEKTSNSKNGESHTHHGPSHQSQKEEKDVNNNIKKSSETNEADTFLKRYKIIEKIGEGSYSEVLKCQNRQEGTQVACKRLKHIYKSWSDVNNINEIATLRTIPRHANILQMIEIHYDETLGKVSLVFELMDVNLYELIKDRKRLLPESRVRNIMFQLFKALRHLHTLGIFHRDIKPENILIKTKTDQLKLGDLGSVRGMFSRPPYTEYISTRWYRSPECLLTAGHYSHKMDVWAAGCVFYEVLTLRPLFPGSSEIDQINRINNILGPPPIKLLENFQKQAEMEKDTYRGQSQLNRRQQIQKVLDDYSSKYLLTNESKNSSNKSIKSSSRNNIEYHFSGKEGTGLDKILPTHISREAKEIIKVCLSYDPEMRPTAKRIIQLTYFYELRESHNKNPEKVSSKPVLTICGETPVEQEGTIELGTLGDNKMKYRRGHHSQRSTKQSSTAYSQSKPSSKIAVIDRRLSINKDANNNSYVNKSSMSPNENSNVGQSRSRLSNADMRGLSKSSKAMSSQAFSVQNKERKASLHDINNNKVQRHSRMSVNQAETETQGITKIPLPKARSKHYPQIKKNRKDSTTTSSSFESIHNTEKKYKYKFNPSSVTKHVDKNGSLVSSQKDMVKGSVAGLNNLPADIQLSPYVKAPSELKFLQKKIKGDQNQVKKPIGSSHPHPGMPQHSNVGIQKGSLVPAKVAAAAIKFAKVHANNNHSHHNPSMRSRHPYHHRVVEERESHAVADTEGVSPSDENSSVKIGKLRFRHKQQEKQLKADASQTEESSPPPPPPQTLQPPQSQRSRIPVYVDEVQTGDSGLLQSARSQSKQAFYRPSKLTSPPESQNRGTADKWRNTESGIPRIVMSPERERNIRLLRESLTIDKNKRLRLRRLEQDALNEMDTNSSVNLATNGTPIRDGNYNFTSQDTMISGQQGQQQQRVADPNYSSGRYRNSTTDYENPDPQDTSSASAPAIAEALPRNIFNVAGSARKRFVVPSEDLMTKSSSMKKQNMYPPEILDIYSSRYRGPDVNMNILKDNASYVKHPDRTLDVKEKLNQKLEIRRRQQLNSSSVGDHASKLASQRSSTFIHDYGQYSSSVVNTSDVAIAESQPVYPRSTVHTGNKTGRVERRPPLPPGKLLGMRHAETSKALHTYREIPEDNRDVREDRHSYNASTRRASMIPTITGGASNATEKAGVLKSSRRSLSNVGPVEQARKDFKDQTKRRSERMRSTMRDDVFCSSDDDVVISMRKKFDTLISERARRLSESLKSNPVIKENPQETRKYYESDEDTTPPFNRSKQTSNEKARKYARRELRARMAESLTMNNIASNHWRLSEHRPGPILENPSNNSGDYVVAAPSYKQRPEEEKKFIAPPGGKLSYQQTFIKTRRDVNDSGYRDKYHHPQQQQPTVSSRIYPYSRHEQNSRHGQIYSPPGNKPVYQSPDVGAMLHDRKLRYSHNLPVPISNSQSNYNNQSSRDRNIKENLKKRQRI